MNIKYNVLRLKNINNLDFRIKSKFYERFNFLIELETIKF